MIETVVTRLAGTRRPVRRVLLTRLGIIGITLLGAAITCSGVILVPFATPANATTLSSRLLVARDLPLGWKALRHVNAKSVTSSLCSSGAARTRGWTSTARVFTQGPAIPSLDEALETGPNFNRVWKEIEDELDRCDHATLTIDGTKHRVAITSLNLPAVGAASSAYQWHYKVSGIAFTTDLAVIDVDDIALVVAYSDIGSVTSETFEPFVAGALAKVQGATGKITGVLSIASAPVLVAHTTKGDVGYRVLGRGPSLVLIMGYAGTMTTWDPLFVDALAQHFRVVIFDNAGIGKTSRLKGALTIDAMADQTSALITAIGLTRADVLGWSMGGMVAQALAVLHPSQVSRLVLCATFPGVGPIDRPSQAVVNSLTDPALPEAKTALFPADQTAARDAYQLTLSRYPREHAASTTTIAEQAKAIEEWWDGRDRAGRRVASISAPTLVADGTRDNLDPTANDRSLARLIRNSRLDLYHDAGHAFLFQDQSAFVGAIDTFLS